MKCKGKQQSNCCTLPTHVLFKEVYNLVIFRKEKKGIRRFGLILICMIMIGCTGCGNSEEKAQQAETVGPSKPSGAPETVQEMTEEVTVVRPSITPSLSPEPTAAPASVTAVSATPEISSMTEISTTPVVSITPLPEMSPVPTITQAPTITPAKRKSEQTSEEGTLSRPDHPDTVTNDKLIFVGDSRTEGIRDAVGDDSVWSCLSGKGYDWMVQTGVPQIEDEIEKNTAIIFLMGVNDPFNVNNYINYINEKAYEWAAIGAQTYFVSVGPVEKDPYITNAQIESFNTSMENNLSGVKYIDVYTHLVENGYATVDGLHYPANVSIEIYNYILENLEEVRSGIWG